MMATKSLDKNDAFLTTCNLHILNAESQYIVTTAIIQHSCMFCNAYRWLAYTCLYNLKYMVMCHLINCCNDSVGVQLYECNLPIMHLGKFFRHLYCIPLLIEKRKTL